MALPSGRELDPPYEDLTNPMRVDAIQPAADWVGGVCVYAMGVGLILSGVSLLLRFRRSRDDERRQLLWLVFIVVPLPLFVVLAFVTSRNGSDTGTLLATGGFITLIPVAAGLSVLRYRLYDVERIVASTAHLGAAEQHPGGDVRRDRLAGRAAPYRPVTPPRRWRPRSGRSSWPDSPSRCDSSSRTRRTAGSTAAPTTPAG